ncbi:zinc finger protein 235-like isoform X2 [Ischnura elegans]|nr:zinc finger protein 235-like isoform X2 [Ischnura elegans]XP_046400168.1 zinc finger protein 235-like isoform X2 [Ischnura elegans]
MTADTEEQLNVVPRDTKCFICNARVGTSGRSSFNFFQTDTVTSSSHKQVYFCIASILECELLEESVHSQVICKKCYKTINEIDELECKTTELKNEIYQKYQQTSQNRGEDLDSSMDLSDSEVGYDDQNDDDYLGKKVQKVRKKPPPKKFKYVNPLSKKKELIQKKNESCDEVTLDGSAPENEPVDPKFPSEVPTRDQDSAGEEVQLQKNEVKDEGREEEEGGDRRLMEGQQQDQNADSNTNVVLKDGDYFKCVPCDQKLPNTSSVQVHLRRVHGVRAFVCILCTQEFDRKKDLALHMSEVHGEASGPEGNAPTTVVKKENGEETVMYLCELCPEALNTAKALREHKREAHGKAKHKCNVCGKFYGSRNLLSEHMNVHNGVRPYKCELCEKTFASRYCLKVHVKIHDARPRPHMCQECGKTFLCLQHLQQHARTHSDNKDFVCETCGKAFATARNLEVHMVVHSGAKPFACSVCQKGFARRAELVDHERTHTGEKPFQCETCGATFSQRSNLISHRRATHLDDRRFVCDDCGRGFKRRRLLDYHRKAAHTGERPYTCGTCGASFVYPEHYKKHIRVHTGERPYACEVCGKRFGSRDNRNAHRFVHSDKKPYECVVCGMGFMRKPLLYTHMQSQGHLQDAIVINQPRITSVYEERGVGGQHSAAAGGQGSGAASGATTLVNGATLYVSERQQVLSPGGSTLNGCGTSSTGAVVVEGVEVVDVGETGGDDHRHSPTRVVKRVAWDVGVDKALRSERVHHKGGGLSIPLDDDGTDVDQGDVVKDMGDGRHVYTISAKEHIILRQAADGAEQRLRDDADDGSQMAEGEEVGEEGEDEEVEHLIIEGPVHFTEEGTEITTALGGGMVIDRYHHHPHQTTTVVGGDGNERGARVVTLCPTTNVPSMHHVTSTANLVHQHSGQHGTSALITHQPVSAGVGGAVTVHQDLSPTVVVRQNVDAPVHLVQIRIPSEETSRAAWLNLVNQQ